MTVAVLEGHLVDGSTDFDPVVLQSGRVSELSSAYEPDTTRAVCETFEDIMQGVVDKKFFLYLTRRKQEEDRQLIIQQMQRQLTRALPAPEPLEPETVQSVPDFERGWDGSTNSAVQERSHEEEPTIVAYVGDREIVWTEPGDDLLEAFTDAFPRVDATATDIPVLVEKKTGASYKQAFWGKAAGRDFVKPQRQSLRSKIRSAWKYLLRVRRSGQ